MYNRVAVNFVNGKIKHQMVQINYLKTKKNATTKYT